jgi:hypothetical protein
LIDLAVTVIFVFLSSTTISPSGSFTLHQPMSTTLVGKIELCSQIILQLDPLSSSALISTSGPKQLPQLSFPVLTQSPLPSTFKPIPIKTQTSANTEEEVHVPLTWVVLWLILPTVPQSCCHTAYVCTIYI